MPNILVICTANQCRSPIAASMLERALRQRFPETEWHVSSAGTWARPGVPATAAMQTLAQERGIDLSAHRSREVDQAMLSAADLVLVMESGHKEALNIEFADLADRFHLFSEMAGPGYSIADPIGGSAAQYRYTAEELERLIAGGVDRIGELTGVR